MGRLLVRVGTPARLSQAEADIRAGKVSLVRLIR